jgi:hypothetical protein
VICDAHSNVLKAVLPEEQFSGDDRVGCAEDAKLHGFAVLPRRSARSSAGSPLRVAGSPASVLCEIRAEGCAHELRSPALGHAAARDARREDAIAREDAGPQSREAVLRTEPLQVAPHILGCTLNGESRIPSCSEKTSPSRSARAGASRSAPSRKARFSSKIRRRG